MASLNILLRMAVVVVMAGCVAACHVFRIGDNVHYAPGYGYVVYVEHYNRDPHLFGGTAKLLGTYYYVFETKEAATAFLETMQADATARAGHRHKVKYEKGSEEYVRIECALALKACVDPSAPSRAIDRVTPPAPTALTQ
jgi:hypothetical protein